MANLPPFPDPVGKTSEELELEIREYFKKIPHSCRSKLSSEIKSTIYTMLNQLIGAEALKYSQQNDRLILPEDMKVSGSKVQKGPFCGKLFAKNEPVYNCSSCAIDPTCVLCETCFNSTSHEGHDVQIHLHLSGYGCCDCGDLEAFNVPLDCQFHQPSFKKSQTEVEENLPVSIKDNLRCLIRAILDFSIDVFYCTNDDHFGELDAESIRRDGNEMDKIWNPEAESEVRDYTLVLWNDEFHGYNEVISLCKRSMGYSEHMAQKVTSKIDEVGRHALTHSQNIDALIPSATIFTEVNLNVTIRPTLFFCLEELACSLLHYLSLLADKELEPWHNGSFSAYYLNTLSEELLNFDHAKFNPSSEGRVTETTHLTYVQEEDRPRTAEDFFSLNDSFGASALTLLPESHCLVFEEDKLHPTSDSSNPNGPERLRPSEQYVLPVNRFDRILQHDPVLWKSLRLELQALFTRSLLALPDFKSNAALHYGINFPYYAKMDCNRNSEPDTSMLSFAVQVFTAPSIAEVLTSDMRYIQFLLMVLEQEFFHRVTPPDVFGCSTVLPTDVFTYPSDFYDHNPKRSILRALDYFLDHLSVRALISQDYVCQLQFLHFLSGFHGFRPLQRKVEEHVEYEDMTIGIAIETADHLNDMIEMVSSAIHMNSRYTVLNLKHVLNKILLLNEKVLYAQLPIEFHNIESFTCKPQSIIKFSVADKQLVSFYYVLHWYLASLLKTSDIHQPNHLVEYGFDSLKDFMLSVTNSSNFEPESRYNKLLDIFDYPLRSLVLSAQTRAYVWIRNGQNVLIEEHCFRDRPDGYVSHCLFLLQHILVLFPTDLGLLTILDRYSLRSWLTTELKHPIYSKSQILFMASDFLLLVLHCLIERDDIVGTSIETQALSYIARSTFTPTLFSTLNSHLPSFVTKLPNFNQLLSQICDFKPPDNLSDSGHYQLKGAFAHLFNPYHYKLSHSQLDQAENFKKTHSSKDKAYFLPDLLPLPPGTFYHLNQILHEPLLMEVLYFTLYHSLYTPEAKEYLVDYVLQFFIIASVEMDSESRKSNTPANDIWNHATTMRFPRDSEDIDATCTELLIEIAKVHSDSAKEEKLIYVLDLLSKHGAAEAAKKVDEFLSDRLATKENKIHEQRLEERRKAAKARQEQIKRRFREAQSEFVERHSDLYQATNQIEGELEVPQQDLSILPSDIPYLTGSCIICQEEVSPGRPYGIPSLIQPSRILSLFPFMSVNLNSTIQNENGLCCFEKPSNSPVLIEFETDITTSQTIPNVTVNCSGSHISSCGHLIHLACLKVELDSDHYSRSPFNSSIAHLSTYRMFRCPLCKSHNNVLLPVMGNPGISFPSQSTSSAGFGDWITDHNEIRCRLVRTFNQKVPGHYLPEKIAITSTSFSPLDVFPSQTTSSDASDVSEQSPRMSLIAFEDFQKIYSDSDISTYLSESQYPKDLLEIYSVLLKTSCKSYESESGRSSSGNLLVSYGTPRLLLDSLLYSLGYTITMMEVADRIPSDTNSNPTSFIFDRISTISRDTLVILWNTIIDANNGASPQYQKLTLRSVLGKLDLLYGQSQGSPLTEDPFIFLTELAVVTIPSLGPDFRHLIQLMFLVHFTRLIVGCSFSSHYSEPPSFSNMFQIPGSVESLISHIIKSSKSINSEGWNVADILECYPFIRQNLIIFLRKVSILMGAFQFPLARPMSTDDEFEDLLAALGLQSTETIFNDAVNSPVILNIIATWCHKLTWDAASKLMVEFPHAYRLPALGPRIDSMFSVCDDKLLESCKLSTNEATICLLCREIICSGMQCCNVDSASLTRHKFMCGGSLGLFITPKWARLTVMYKNTESLREVPYLNVHGQASSVIRSSSSMLPLFLNTKRYEALLKNVLNHQIPHQLTRESHYIFRQ